MQASVGEYIMKLVFVINGRGGVGKDTLCDAAAKRYKVMNVSTITPIKELATICGWDGRKDNKARKFLSDLKKLTADFNDYPTRWILERREEFLASDLEIMFVHIRESVEIEKFVSMCMGDVKTLLIRGGERFKEQNYGNASDDDVENYSYDYIYDNDSAYDEIEANFCAFIEDIIKQTES